MKKNDRWSDEDLELVARYESSLDKDSKLYFDVDDMLIIIDYYIINNDYHNAETALKYAYSLHPNDRMLNCEKAALLSAKGKLKQALTLIEANRDPDDMFHTFTYAEILYKLGRSDEALPMIRQIFDDEIDDDDELLLDFALDVANLLMAGGNYQESLFYAEKALELYPENTELLEQKGVSLCNLSRIEEGMQCFKKITEIDPFNHSAWLNIGSSYYEHRQYKKALQALNYANAINPNEPYTWIMLANTYFEFHDLENSAKYAEKYLKVYKNDAQAYKLAGDCYLQKDKPKTALKYLVKAEKYDNSDVEIYEKIGVCYMLLGDEQNMHNAFNRAIEIDPNNISVRRHLANYYADEQNWEATIEQLKQIFTIDETDKVSLFMMGYAYALSNNFEESLIFFKKVENETGEFFRTTKLLIAADYFCLKQFDKAQEYYDKSKLVCRDSAELFKKMCKGIENYINL